MIILLFLYGKNNYRATGARDILPLIFVIFSVCLDKIICWKCCGYGLQKCLSIIKAPIWKPLSVNFFCSINFLQRRLKKCIMASSVLSPALLLKNHSVNFLAKTYLFSVAVFTKLSRLGKKSCTHSLAAKKRLKSSLPWTGISVTISVAVKIFFSVTSRELSSTT